jgi:hypothetical protein
MSKPSPHHRTEHDGEPASTGADPTLTIDLVAGDPPVPITVWRTARRADEQPTAVPARLAYRLVAAYSRPGEAVVDLADGHALTSACLHGGRRHHRAWFTETSSLIIGAPTPAPDNHRQGTDADDGGAPPEMAVWFGDDLTDDTDEPVIPLPADGTVAGATSLLVACWPLDPSGEAANRVRLAWLLAAGAELLRPGGCLVLVVSVPTGAQAQPEDFGPLVAAASASGLGYLQHIVAVTADTDGDHFTYHVTDTELLEIAGAAGQPWAVAHLRVHADLLVFSRPQAQSPVRGSRVRGGARD